MLGFEAIMLGRRLRVRGLFSMDFEDCCIDVDCDG
jgi:hypothetical protein